MIRIPAGEYFLQADNRPASEDSRLWSPQTIPRSAVVGKVVKIVIPPPGKQPLGADSTIILEFPLANSQTEQSIPRLFERFNSFGLEKTNLPKSTVCQSEGISSSPFGSSYSVGA